MSKTSFCLGCRQFVDGPVNLHRCPSPPPVTGPIQTEWIHYSAVLPSDAGPVQLDETRRAFFAGAYSLFHHIMAQLEPGEDATNADLKLLDVMWEELERWRLLESTRGSGFSEEHRAVVRDIDARLTPREVWEHHRERSKKGTPPEGG